MRTTREPGIRRKLSAVVVLAGTLAIVPTFVAQYLYERTSYQSAAQLNLQTQASLLAVRASSELASGNAASAASLVDSLAVDPEIREATLYDARSTPLARYRARNAATQTGFITASQPVTAGGQIVGKIVVSRATRETDSELLRYLSFSSLAALLSLGVGSILSCRLQRRITAPIAELSAVARRVTAEKNYSVRAARLSNDELGSLVDSFNEMLSQIEAGDRERRTALHSLKESEERYALAARGANDGLWDWKITSNEIFFSPRWRQMLGYSENEIGADPEEWLGRIHPSDRIRVEAAIRAHFDGQTPEFVSEYRMRRKDGVYVWMLSRGIAIKNAEGGAERMAGSQTDITEGKIADPLTGLPNRIYLIDKLDAAFDAARYGNSTFAALFVDLDRFKLVNDSMGHAAGDELLIEVAARLRSAVSNLDFIDGSGPRATIARLGGDEFAIMLTDLRSPSDAHPAAERVLKQLAAPVFLHGRQLFLSASIGIALNSTASTPEDLLRNADTAMYHAKVTGKARFAVFDETMRERAAQRVEVESGLRRAVEMNELVLFYQPQVSTTTKQVTGYEALVRWNHPERGLLGPGEFIPIAEECGLILPIGRWVLREACRQMVEWQKRVDFDPPLTISVNVSPQELREPDFVENVADAIQTTGIDPACVRLELTESSIIGNTDQALETLCRLKALNVGLEIDDFGTGYSSLSYLQRLPFDTVKIDRSFIREIDEDNDSAEIVRTILDLTRSLGMTAIAEGVETRGQANRLSGLGCEQIQGFYYSKPVTSQTVLAIMQDAQESAEGRTSLSSLERALLPHVDPLLQDDTAVLTP